MLDGTACSIAIRWMSLGIIDGKSTLIQTIAWCRQATRLYLNQCWPRFTPYAVTRHKELKDERSCQWLSTKTAETPLLAHWSYYSLVLHHQCALLILQTPPLRWTSKGTIASTIQVQHKFTWQRATCVYRNPCLNGASSHATPRPPWSHGRGVECVI